MMELTGSIIFLPTHDLNATHQFYANLLQLSLIRDQGDCRIYRLSDAAYVGFCQRATLPQPPESVILTLLVEDVDELYAILTAQGAVSERTPQLNTTYRIYHAFLRDPNGYRLEIQRFLEPLS